MPQLQSRRQGALCRCPGLRVLGEGCRLGEDRRKAGKWSKTAQVRARNQDRGDFVWPELSVREWDQC